MNPSISENNEHNYNSISGSLETLGLFTSPSSPQKNMSLNKTLPHLTS